MVVAVVVVMVIGYPRAAPICAQREGLHRLFYYQSIVALSLSTHHHDTYLVHALTMLGIENGFLSCTRHFLSIYKNKTN